MIFLKKTIHHKVEHQSDMDQQATENDVTHLELCKRLIQFLDKTLSFKCIWPKIKTHLGRYN